MAFTRDCHSASILSRCRLHIGQAIVAASLLLVCSADAQADADGFDYGEVNALFADIDERDGHIDLFGLSTAGRRYSDWKRAFVEQTGLNYVIEDRLINQLSSGAGLSDNELNIIARLDLFNQPGLGSGSLNVWGQFAQSLFNKTAGEFQADLGVLSPLNGGNSGPPRNNEILQMLAYEHVLPNGKTRFQAGKLAARTLVNLNRYANGDSEMFFSPMIGNNPVSPYTALLGLGVFAQHREELYYISAMVRSPDTELGIGFDAIEAGNLSVVGEAAITPTTPGLGYGEYRLTISYNNETTDLPSVTSVAASFDQDIGERLGAFFRVAHSASTFRSFNARVAGGFQVKKPFGYTFDRLGVGAWWGDPSHAALDHEVGIEVYYKAQVTPFLEITPNIQMVLNPALSNDIIQAIAGLRLRTEF